MARRGFAGRAEVIDELGHEDDPLCTTARSQVRARRSERYPSAVRSSQELGRVVTPRWSPTGRFAGRLTLCAAVAGAALVSTAQSATPDAAGRAAQRIFPGGPYFTVVCGFSHRNNDDPIRFPNQPGRSHNHTYVGNRTVNAATTAASLRGGPTTCDLDQDSSTYWVPTVYEGAQPIHPLAGVVYYTKRVTGAVQTPPVGLKMVAGNPTAHHAQSKEIASWSCGGVGGAPRFAAIRACGRDDALELEVVFQNCWNGRDLDSANHKRHVAYAKGGRCPATHPVAMPTIMIVLLYPPITGRARTAAGKWATHADFINGWDQEALVRLTAGLNAQR
jgi:hypothetical protein